MPTSHLGEPVAHHLPRTPTTNITIGPDTYTVLGEPSTVHYTPIRRKPKAKGMSSYAIHPDA